MITFSNNIHRRWKMEPTEVQNPLKYLLGLSLTCEYEKSELTQQCGVSQLPEHEVSYHSNQDVQAQE